MNRQQRTVLLVAIAFVVVTGVYPPWLYVSHVLRIGQLTRFAGFTWLFRRPTVDSLTGGFWADHDIVDVELDGDILKVEWGLIVLVTAGLVGFFHGDRRERVVSPTARPLIQAALKRLRQWLGVPKAPGVVRHSDRIQRPAPHWALDLIVDPKGDLDWVMERAERAITNPGCFPVGPAGVLFGFSFEHPDIPPWFPEKYNDRTLSHQERLIWFDQALEQSGDFPQEWPRYAHTTVRQLFVVDALIGAYEACAEGNLPEPDFTQSLWKTGPPREPRRA